MNSETIKREIKKTYGDIAKGNLQVGCCTSQSICCTNEFSTSMAEIYDNFEGYHRDADLSLGCGIPIEIAKIKEGDTVVDLGSGAGNDVFVARRIVGETGKVIGVDMTAEMVIRALQNNQKLGYKNVEFVLGDIENMKEVPSNMADVVISNCVLNLVPNKEQAFTEAYRILKIGGHISISDIVYVGKILEEAEMYAGCISGASEKGNYLGLIKSVGFKNIQIKKERQIDVPDELLLKYMNSEEELEEFKNSTSGIYSISVYADKLDEGVCCETTESGCCGTEVSITDKSEEISCCGTNSKNSKSSCC